LRHARGLTQQQIDRAFGGERTLLPGDLEIPSTWLAEDERARQRPGNQDADALTKAYDLLGVKPKASMQEIRVAWLRLVKELHPDIAADDPASCERLKVINRAYQGLKSLEQREMAWRAQRRANSMARATFVVFLLLPVAAALAVGAWTYGVKGPIHQSVAALLELAGPGRPGIEGTSGQVQDAEEKPTVVARADLEGLPARQGEVGSLPDAASDDDAAWARAAAEATSVSLHRYLGRFPHGRYAQKAMDELTQVASVEVALAKDFRSRDAAAIQQAAPMLRRYLADYPTGQLANEARGKLAAIEAGGGADVAWSDAEQRDGKRALAENVNAHAVEMTGASGHRVLALAEPAGRDRIASSDTQRGNGQASLGTYLELRSDGRHVDTEAAGVAELDGIPEARSATAAGIKTPKQALRTARPVAHATQQWRSASEPFVAADGRIR
jgi:curved DNA-binding protein CbpA